MKTLLTSLLLLVSTALFSQNCGLILIKEPTYDFGKIVFTGDTLVANFFFRNAGTGDLNILSSKASCGCTVASYPETTAPGTEGVIVIKYFSTTSGFINKSVSLTTNDPNNPNLILRIKGETIKQD